MRLSPLVFCRAGKGGALDKTRSMSSEQLAACSRVRPVHNVATLGLQRHLTQTTDNAADNRPHWGRGGRRRCLIAAAAIACTRGTEAREAMC